MFSQFNKYFSNYLRKVGNLVELFKKARASAIFVVANVERGSGGLGISNRHCLADQTLFQSEMYFTQFINICLLNFTYFVFIKSRADVSA